MNKKLYNGQKLKEIFWTEGFCRVGVGGCTNIEVVMENGQMAGVPWALVTFEGTEQRKYNLALTEGVTLSGDSNGS